MQKERCTSEYMSIVSAGVPVKLLFLTRSSKKFVEESVSLKTFNFFSNKLSLDLEISTFFFIAVFILQKSDSSVKTISISPDNGLSLLRRYISDVVICLFISLTSMKTGNRYMYINISIYLHNRKILNELFSSDLKLIL